MARTRVCWHARGRQTHTDSIKTAEQLASLYRAQGRQEEAGRLHSQIGKWRRQRTDGAESSGSWQRAQVPFPLSVAQIPEGYKLKSRIYGHKGLCLKHIEQQSGAERVFLRLGSAHAASPASTAADGGTVADGTAAGAVTAGGSAGGFIGGCCDRA